MSYKLVIFNSDADTPGAVLTIRGTQTVWDLMAGKAVCLHGYLLKYDDL